MTTLRFLIRLDASILIGTGHAMRCLALAEALHDTGVEVILAASEFSEALARRYAHENIPVMKINAVRGSVEDAQETGRLARKYHASMIIADPYTDMSRDWLDALCGSDIPAMLFTDVAEYAAPLPEMARVLINPARRDEGKAGRICLYGPEYQLLRRSFREAPVHRDRNRLLMTFGGTDTAALSVPVLQALKRDTACPPISVVIGGGVADADDVQRTCQVLGADVHRDVDSLAPLMVSAKVAITAGGSTVGELAALGVPSVVVAVAENQRAGVKAAFRDGWTVACDVTVHTPQEIAEEALKLYRDENRWQKMAAKTKGLVNKDGAAVVAQALTGLTRP